MKPGVGDRHAGDLDAVTAIAPAARYTWERPRLEDPMTSTPRHDDPYATHWHREDGAHAPMPTQAPFGPNVFTGWEGEERHGTVQAALRGSGGAALTVRWRGYRLGDRHACLANFLVGDRMLRVTESLIDISSSNSGSTTWRAMADTWDLADVTLLVYALSAEPSAAFEPAGPDAWKLSVRESDSGAIYNTVVYMSRSLEVTIDLAAGRVTVTHVQYVDTST
jgi:hypothetical protein